MTKSALITLTIGVCTLGLLSSSCKPKEETQKQSADSNISIKVFPVVQQEVAEYGEWFAYLRGTESTSINPRVTGFVQSQNYSNGARVKKDDVLFVIDQKLFIARLEQAKANLVASRASRAAAEAGLQQAEMDLQRYESLYNRGTGAISEKEVQDARQMKLGAEAQVKLQIANIEQMQAAVKRAQIELDYTTVRAPFDGVVGTALISKGQLVSPATTLTSIEAINPIRVDFAVTAERLKEYINRHGYDAEFPSFELLLEDGSTYPAKGKLTAFDSRVNENGLLEVTGQIANPQNYLRPGMPVRVRIAIDHREATLVPKDAIQSVLRTRYIIVPTPQGVPTMVPVKEGSTYEIVVTEKSGFESTQTMVAITGQNAPLAEEFKKLGYDKVTDTPVVCDKANQLYVVRLTGANSRLVGDDKKNTQSIKTTLLSFEPNLVTAKKEKKEKKLDPNAKPSFPPFLVYTTKLRRQDVNLSSEWFGSLRGVNETELRAQVSGFVVQQNFTDGDRVKEGDVLFLIDPAPYQAIVDEAKANLLIAEAAAEQGQVTLTMNEENLIRYKKLNAESPGAVTDKTITDTETAVIRNKADLLKYQANIELAKAALNQAEINLGYTKVTAPFDGHIGISNPSIGDLVGPDSPEALVSLSSVNPMRVDFNVSGEDALQGYTNTDIKEIDPKAFPFDIILEDGSTYSQKGYIVSVDNAVSRTTGTLSIVGRVANEQGHLRSGVPVRVEVKNKTLEGAYLVPAHAPVNAQGLDLLMFVLGDGKLLPLPISKGPLVNIMEKDASGKEVLQPMQTVYVNSVAILPKLLEETGAPSVEALIFGPAEVKSWKELFLKKAGVADVRALIEKQAGKALPDDTPASIGAENWDEFFFKQNGVKDYHEFILKQAGASDDLDFMAKGAGEPDALTMILKKEGITDPTQAEIIVEGGINALRAFGANEAAGGVINKIVTKPYAYTNPQTVESSVTAKKSHVASPAPQSTKESSNETQK